ncbi:MAG TPA: ParB/RepB/Spo0J family partition protein [Caulobacteraceae bacterium]|jgi:ParB family chromosome partitioning protein
MASEPRRGLGRGLSALLGEAEQGAPEGSRDVPVDRIHANPEQPRRTFDEGELEELAASLREKGVLQPILLRRSPLDSSLYQIVAGERRWRAAQRAGLRMIPALVRDIGDSAAIEIAIVENVQRADLNPVEAAAGYQALMDRFGHTQEAVATVVGKSRSHVANALRLLALPEGVRAEIASGRLSGGHAKALAAAPDPEALARQVLERGLNVREAEVLARGERGGRRRKRPKRVDTVDAERRLSEATGLKVEIVDRGDRGEVRIAYQTLEQFDEILLRLVRRPDTQA